MGVFTDESLNEKFYGPMDRTLAVAKEILDAHPDWDDAKISHKASATVSYVRLQPDWIAAMRNIRDRNLPAFNGHAHIVRWGHLVGTLAGWRVRSEVAIRLSSTRRVVPDLLFVDDDGDAAAVIEVKPSIGSERTLKAAVRQVTRYADVLEDLDPTGVMAIVLTPAATVNESYAESRGVSYWDAEFFLHHVTHPAGRLYRAPQMAA